MKNAWCVILSIVCIIPAKGTAAEELLFVPHELDPFVGQVCYAVTTADVNHDGRLDVVAVSENRVQWYENPSWQKHVIVENQLERDHVCLAAHDIDGDGRLDFALGAGWTKIGTIQWITRSGAKGPLWNVHPIHVELSTHRMSFADVLGLGRPQLIVSPLLRTTGAGVRLLVFPIPQHPASEAWQPQVLHEGFQRMHNHTHLDYDGDGVPETLVACQEGVWLLQRQGEKLETKQLGRGADGVRPEDRGAGEVKVGRDPQGNVFLATIEPMHGHQAVLYFPREDQQLPWTRVVLTEDLRQGHAVWLADLDGRPGDEVVIGHREAGPGDVSGPGLYVFQRQSDSSTDWRRHVVDNGGCAVEDVAAADFDADGRVDLVAGGRATHNVKIYWNRRP
ncbi:MAG: hypothetical protein KatS3mg114_0618 [Planctomycetaceae bacterium]|nr:MAG: hypothetical protein KatS3mg114_0618 [Planctomycetaceae bacterium]